MRTVADRHLLRMLTSSADDFSGGTNINDLERPWNLRREINFSRFPAATDIWKMHFRRNYWS